MHDPFPSASLPEGSAPLSDVVPPPAREVPVRGAAVSFGAEALAAALADALDAVEDGVAVLDADGAFRFANRAFVRLLGLPSGDASGSGFGLRALLAPDEPPIPEAEASCGPVGPLERREVRLRAKDGSLLLAHLRPRPAQVAGRASGFLLVVARDARERRLREMEVERARKDLAQTEKLAALGSLVSGVAHEIRTPLVAIQNSATLLASRLARAPALAHEERAPLDACVAEIDLGVDRIRRLLRDLRRFSRMPAGEPVRADLAETVDEAVRLWSATHPGVGVRIDARHEPQPPVRIDRVKVQQVVLNLLQNAAEAMPSGGTVRLRTSGTSEGAMLVVRDDGEGMDERTRVRAFEPLFTTKPDAMGLGLSVARRIVELHRGRIACESAPGRGATFTVVLPRA